MLREKFSNQGQQLCKRIFLKLLLGFAAPIWQTRRLHRLFMKMLFKKLNLLLVDFPFILSQLDGSLQAHVDDLLIGNGADKYISNVWEERSKEELFIDYSCRALVFFLVFFFILFIL